LEESQLLSNDKDINREIRVATIQHSPDSSGIAVFALAWGVDWQQQ